MPNYSKFSFHCPFKFVPNTNTPGIHFDDDVSCKQILPFQYKAFYTQKWLRGTITRLQCISTIAPDDLKIYNAQQQLVKNIAWIPMFLSNPNCYELDFDISNIPEATYWLYQKFEVLSYKAEFISEAISSKDTHKFVKPIKYRHSENDHDMVWTTGIEMVFCVECEIMDWEFKSEKTTSMDQTRDSFLLKGVPYRIGKLEIGDEKGCSPYIFDILTRIFCCDYVSIKGKQFSAKDGGDFELHKVKNYPLYGGTLEVLESKNLYSIQHNDLTQLAPGIVTSYFFDTGFWGPGNIVPITEIEST